MRMIVPEQTENVIPERSGGAEENDGYGRGQSAELYNSGVEPMLAAVMRSIKHLRRFEELVATIAGFLPDARQECYLLCFRHGFEVSRNGHILFQIFH